MNSQYQRYNPSRLPAWRYERALELVEGGRRSRRPRRYDDAQVVLMWKFLTRFKAAKRRRLREELFNHLPALYYAYEIYAGPDELLRSNIEARLLAGMDDVRIARLSQTLPVSVYWYEQMFFHVRDRLAARDWVRRIILQPAVQQALVDPGAQHEAVSKLFGYYGGPTVLEAVLSGFLPPEVGETGWAELNRYFTRHFELQLRGRLAMASQSLEINKFNFADLMASHAKLKELEIRSGQSPDQEHVHVLNEAHQKMEQAKSPVVSAARPAGAAGSGPATVLWNPLTMHS